MHTLMRAVVLTAAVAGFALAGAALATEEFDAQSKDVSVAQHHNPKTPQAGAGESKETAPRQD